MKTSRVARRYAQALLESAERDRLLDAVLADLRVLQEHIAESREFRSFLRSPVIKGHMKLSILRNVFGGSVSALTLDFLRLLIEKRREALLSEVIAELFLMNDVRQGIVTLELKAALELSDAHRSAITQRFEHLTGKKIRISFSVDTSLRGGILVRVGDTVYDGSIKRQLELLRERFAQGVVSN